MSASLRKRPNCCRAAKCRAGPKGDMSGTGRVCMLVASVEAQPLRHLAREGSISIQGDRFSDLVSPFCVAQENCNQGSDVSPYREVYGKSWVFDANVDGRSIQHEPHQTEAGATFRYARELKAKKHALAWQCLPVDVRAQFPHIEGWIEVAGLKPIACVP